MIFLDASAMIQKSVRAVFVLHTTSETDYEAKSTLCYVILQQSLRMLLVNIQIRL